MSARALGFALITAALAACVEEPAPAESYAQAPPGPEASGSEAQPPPAEPSEPIRGMVMSTGDGSVWPPVGQGCDTLVACCEGNGYIRGGAAVGPSGLACLMAAAPAPAVDCTGGLEMLRSTGACR